MSFFKTRKNKQYNYKPIFYNPEKEEKEARKDERRISFRNEESAFKKKNFKDGDHQPYKNMQQQMNRRMLFLTGLIAGLLILGYYLWFRFLPYLK